jgi:phosphatidylinositol phospholipase C delta
MSLPKPSFFEADAPSSTSASSDEPEEKIIKEGITEIKEGITEMKKTWRKIRGKDNSIPKPKVKMSFRLAALLVYTVGVKCHGLAPETTYAPEHVFSLSESGATKLLKESTAELIQHTQKHLVRIYPKGTRVNSTNYQPHRYWASGAQLTAINWQTFGECLGICSDEICLLWIDLGYMINQAMFQRNGRAGYVLKPDALRLSEKGLLSKRTQHFFDVTVCIFPRYICASSHSHI